jgi:hypothetical protein
MYIFGGTVDNNIRSGEMYRFQLAAFPKCTLQDDYGKMLRSLQFHDVDFHLGDIVVPAHAAIVAARSKWLRGKLIEAMDQRDSTTDGSKRLAVSLAEVTSDAGLSAFQLVLDFIYTDEIDPTGDKRELAASNNVVLTMMQVYTLAGTFQMDRLSHLCCLYKEFCLKFVIKESNYNQIVMSNEFESLDQSLMVEIIRRRQCPSHTPPRSSSSNSATSAEVVHCASPDLVVAGGTSLQEDMKHFLDSPDGDRFSDVYLTLDTAVIPSHKAVLAARSSYFEGLFRSFNPSDDKISISIGDMVPSRQSFSSLLRYIYHGDVTMPPEDSLYLFSAPSYYIFSNNRLQVYCKANLERNVTVDNVIQILEASDRSQAHDMKKYSLSLIVRHFAKVAKLPRIQSLSRELLLDILQALADEMLDSKLTQDVSFLNSDSG